ncbi:hypothetical protein GWI33_002742 [Rhynchophorus ferrugineus]|uniref:Uncharacterized protein n=1 Tax=Rhynchophorus ferrugineus TaxID=354439 RepID=A0A834IP61_RHYFE|nr:hypothetical protein GWI33_002742 [Rhynchophorus ferrugineus]
MKYILGFVSFSKIKNIQKLPQTNDYVVVKLTAKKSFKHYVAIILSKTEDGYVAKFMRKAMGSKFIFPSNDDVDHIDVHEVADILSQPTINNRQQYSFNVDLNKYKYMN